MKKNTFLLIVTLTAIAFCHACKGDVSSGGLVYPVVRTIDYYAAGMHYKVFESADGSLFVVNVTNDSLNHLHFIKP